MSAPKQVDPAVEIARRIGEAEAVVRTLEARELAAKKSDAEEAASEAAYAGSHWQHAVDRLDCLREQLSYVEATTVDGALAQFIELHKLAMFMAETGVGDDARKIGRQCNRLAYSAFKAMTMAGLADELTDEFLRYMMAPHLDPQLSLDEALGLIGKPPADDAGEGEQ